MDSLDLHYAKSILLKTLENAAPCQISDYLPIASNWRTLQDVINALVKDGYLLKEEKIDQRKRYEISLTSKGHRVAEMLQISIQMEARVKARMKAFDAAFVTLENELKEKPVLRMVVDMYSDERDQQRVEEFKKMIDEWFKKNSDIEHFIITIGPE